MKTKYVAVIEVNINHSFTLNKGQSRAMIAFAKASVPKKKPKGKKK